MVPMSNYAHLIKFTERENDWIHDLGITYSFFSFPIAALVMLLKIWFRCFLAVVFMHMCRGAKGNKTIPDHVTYDCSCTDQDDKVYNLAPLAKESGKPRFAK